MVQKKRPEHLQALFTRAVEVY